ncbi:hypothetical protein FB557_0464 [Marihabitans asiaticum]|uniref:LPXTG-motif cell wall-anchored protein n=1 Tax=Marihabitans asiaticum TaxID=415218 RepID=A0A560WH65_9MICO|nr:hypothetical protein [Marihabitans asiaticum]TWD16918.1 hypothetical protein FB557_0464 [Marihabitans asiaticum]
MAAMTTTTASAADIGDDTSVRGVQITTEDCERVEVTIDATLTGTTDDGGGLDSVYFSLWDDGEIEAMYTAQVPVGETVNISVVLGFSGLYQLGAEGVGITVGEAEGARDLFREDPFIPEDSSGECNPDDGPTATTSTSPSTTEPTSSTTSTTSEPTSTTSEPTSTTSEPTSTTSEPTSTTSEPTSTTSEPTSTTSEPTSTTSEPTGPVVETDRIDPGSDQQATGTLAAGLGLLGAAGALVAGRRRTTRRH